MKEGTFRVEAWDNDVKFSCNRCGKEQKEGYLVKPKDEEQEKILFEFCCTKRVIDDFSAYLCDDCFRDFIKERDCDVYCLNSKIAVWRNNMLVGK